MTQNSGMPQNPGDPDNTDPEVTSADRAEAAAAEAQEAQAAQDAQADSAEEAELDPTLDADLEAALADVSAEDAADQAEAAADAAADQGNSLEAQLAERTEDLQRLNAEYTNYRRRTERERQAVIEASKAKVLAEFLPILDDLELARQHGDLEKGPLKAISDKLSGVLEKNQLQPFGEEGDAFDPEIHEAVQDLSSGGEQAVGTVLRRGYKVGEKLVRTAMVIIADAPDASTEAGEGSAESAGSESASE